MYTQMFFGWRDAIVRYEIIVLETLCFDLTVSHPYEPLLDILGELQGNFIMLGFHSILLFIVFFLPGSVRECGPISVGIHQ